MGSLALTVRLTSSRPAIMGHLGTMLLAIIPLLTPLASCAVDNFTCSTVGGPSYPAQCVFPFNYKEQEYHGCTFLQETAGLDTWCATQVDNNREILEGSWGICSASCPSARRAVRVYSASLLGKLRPKDQITGELASKYENQAQSGAYVTRDYEQAKEWLLKKELCYICEADLDLDEYENLDTMVFAPPEQEGSFQMLMDSDDYEWTVTSERFFEEYVKDNMKGLCSPVFARHNTDGQEDLVLPIQVDTLEASLMYSGNGHQIFIKAGRMVFDEVITNIECKEFKPKPKWCL